MEQHLLLPALEPMAMFNTAAINRSRDLIRGQLRVQRIYGILSMLLCMVRERKPSHASIFVYHIEINRMIFR